MNHGTGISETNLFLRFLFIELYRTTYAPWISENPEETSQGFRYINNFFYFLSNIG